ncbi:MAG: ATP-binding protein [Eubacterium sp.]|nr:ATP-binding protein [Eubacterium sp.]
MQADTSMVSKLFFRLLPVQVLLVAVGGINSIIDGAVGAHFMGSAAMSVIGFFFPIFQIMMAIGNVMLGGSQIMCGKSLGKNDMKKTSGYFSLDILMMTIIPAVFMIICLVFPHSLASFLADKSTNTDHLADYIRGYAPGFIPAVLGTHFSGFLQIEGRQKRTYVGFAVMAVTNTALDILLVGVLDMGLFGLGLATTLSGYAFCFTLVSFYFTKKSVMRFSFKEIDFRDLGPMIKIGFPGAISSICMAIRASVLNYVLMNESMNGPIPATGDDAVAALAAMNTFGALLYAMSGGVCSVTRILVSVFVGEDDRIGIRSVMKTALFKGTAAVTAVGVLVVVFSGAISQLFFSDPNSVGFQLTQWLFVFYAISMPLSCITMVYSNYFQSTGRLMCTHAISVVDGVLGASLSAIILAPFFGAIGVWMGQAIGGVLSVITAIVCVMLKSKCLPTSFDKQISIPEEIGIDDDKKLELSVYNEEEVVQVSVKAIEFCRAQKMPEKQAFHIGLSLEEIAANIIKHGFADGKKHTTNIRIINYGDKVLLRVKDDCKTFNPKEWMEMMNPEDITHNIGLRIVTKYVNEVSYQNALGLNILSLYYAC